MNNNPIILLSCEHAVNRIPLAYQNLFAEHQCLLSSHWGVDFGALKIAQRLARLLKSKLINATTSRLLIDCNRSLTHPRCFSIITKPLSQRIKQQIIAEYYLPYRKSVEQFIQTEINHQHRVIHLPIHSFTPEFYGTIREIDIGILYDPQKLQEKIFATHWKKALKRQSNHLRIRLNRPYQGKSDGLTTTLRKKFPPERYLGIEVEINQALLNKPILLDQITHTLLTTLETILRSQKNPCSFIHPSSGNLDR